MPSDDSTVITYTFRTFLVRELQKQKQKREANGGNSVSGQGWMDERGLSPKRWLFVFNVKPKVICDLFQLIYPE